MFQKSFRNLMVAVALSLPVVSLNVPIALADRQNFTLVNKTDHVITELKVSTSGSNDWGGDILGVEVVGSNYSTDIIFEGNAPDCLYDVKAVFTDGTKLDERQINLCEIGTLNIGEGG